MAGLKGKSGSPGNVNAFKHGLAAFRSAARKASLSSKLKTFGQKFGQWKVLGSFSKRSNSVQSLEKIGGADGSRTHCITRTKKGSSFCGAGGSSAFEIGGIGEPLKIFTLSFEHTLTTCWIHIKLRRHLAALLEFRAQFAIGQN